MSKLIVVPGVGLQTFDYCFGVHDAVVLALIIEDSNFNDDVEQIKYLGWPDELRESGHTT